MKMVTPDRCPVLTLMIYVHFGAPCSNSDSDLVILGWTRGSALQTGSRGMTKFWILRPHVEVDMRYLTRHMHLICVQQVRTHVPSLPPIYRHLHCVRFPLVQRVPCW